MTSPMLRLWHTVRPIRGRLFLGLFAAVLSSTMALMIPQVLERIVNRLDTGATATAVWTGGAVILGLGFLEASLLWLRRMFAVSPSTKTEMSMRTDFYAQVQRLPVAFHDQWGSGQLLSRMMSDIAMIRRWVAFGMIMVVNSVAMITIGIVMLVRSSALLALVFFILALPLTYITFRFNQTFSVLTRRSQDQNGDLATTIEQSVQGIRVLKAFGRGPSALDGFVAQASELRDTEVRKAGAQALFSMATLLLPELAMGVSLLIGLHLAANGDMTVGALASYFATAALIVGPLQWLGMLFGQAVNTRTALDRHYDVMDTIPEITSPESTRSVNTAQAAGALSFENVHFRYKDSPARIPDLLRGLNLEVRPGETMALVGLTGTGKSTLLQLVPRLYDVTDGAIRIDGVDIRDMSLDSLRTLTAVAFEDPTLFSSSVRENVMLGADPSLSEEAANDLLHLALRTADAEYVHDLPDGVETRIGEEGLSLSGGQRQRLALARAIAARPTVLLLDDPLSALDTKTEERVTERLRNVLDGTTTLIIAHRTSTVALADRVALLDEGQIVAVGTHEHLMATSPRYAHVIAAQELEAKNRVTMDDLAEVTARESEKETTR